ncbi:hypothetical protein DPMN_145132 [Dreissena polymorpha]|uniref:Uncharacterized protein n=1 Tax=Dreissena polymorpha TaxID=45954 RepID=A0A9D4J0X9_DREPO|nr:hypothetical protein DPMN_145132 [Dreissena polymorpha]
MSNDSPNLKEPHIAKTPERCQRVRPESERYTTSQEAGHQQGKWTSHVLSQEAVHQQGKGTSHGHHTSFPKEQNIRKGNGHHTSHPKKKDARKGERLSLRPFQPLSTQEPSTSTPQQRTYAEVWRIVTERHSDRNRNVRIRVEEKELRPYPKERSSTLNRARNESNFSEKSIPSTEEKDYPARPIITGNDELQPPCKALEMVVSWLNGRHGTMDELLECVKMHTLLKDNEVKPRQSEMMKHFCRYLDRPVPEKFRQVPPNSVSVLLHWRVLHILCASHQVERCTFWKDFFTGPIVKRPHIDEEDDTGSIEGIQTIARK